MKIMYAIYSFFLIMATAMITKYFVDMGLIPFYDMLEKPFLTPPKHYFSIIWGILYVLMFVGFYIALIEPKTYTQSLDLHLLFVQQLFLQILWTFCFFYMHQLCISVFIIVLLGIVTAFLMHTLFFIDLWAFILFIPYLLWLLFATYLNVFIVLLN